METFITEIHAKDPKTGRMSFWSGPRIHSNSWEEAEEYLIENSLGYCKIIGIFEKDIDFEL